MLFLIKQDLEGLAEHAEFIMCHFSNWRQEKFNQKLNLKYYFIWLAQKVK